MSKKYRSEAMAAIHEMMEDLHDGGVIDKQTMRRFDDACLTPIRPLKPEEIKAIREREHVSQTVFANYLNVTSSLVSKWERGEKRPYGASLKLAIAGGKEWACHRCVIAWNEHAAEAAYADPAHFHKNRVAGCHLNAAFFAERLDAARLPTWSGQSWPQPPFQAA